MNELTVFENNHLGKLRTAEENGEVYFCLRDICEILSIENVGNVRNRLSEKGIRTMDTLTKGGMQKLIYVDESNLYKTIFMSRKQEAEAFTDWVTSEVLPSIRKNGGYINGQETMTADEFIAAALIMAQKKIEERDKQIAEMKPKALFADCVTASETSILVRDFAKMVQQKTNISIGGGRMWEWLRKKGYICKGSCMPTQRYMEMGLFEIEERAISDGDSTRLSQTTKITGKGQRYFFQKLLEDYGYDTGRNQVQ